MSHQHPTEDKVSVKRSTMSKWVGKLTYPTYCPHAKGDPVVCDGCHYRWEQNAMQVKAALLTVLKYKKSTVVQP